MTPNHDKLGTSEVFDFSDITTICILRAGLYVSLEGRLLLDDNPHQYILLNNADDISKSAIENQHVIIVDSVINSGKTLTKYLERVSEAKSSMLVSMVMQEGLISQIEQHYSQNSIHSQ